jgi:hypothetical protein
MLAAIFLLLACDTNDTQDPDGDQTLDGDADVTDGDATDGDLMDGDEPDGDVVDGDAIDGDAADGDEPDGDLVDGDTSDVDIEEETDVEETGLPDHLTISFSRPDAGEPVTEQEIAAFTRKFIDFYKQLGYFDWVMRASHGVDSSSGYPDYLVWYGSSASKEGDTVTFTHTGCGGGHNIMIPTPHVLAGAIATYLLTGEEAAAKVAAQYCRGITATMKGMVFGEDDPLPYLMARNVIAMNQDYYTQEGYHKVVDYSSWYCNYSDWNTGSIEIENNPTWGHIWVTNMRSKDDVPHIYMVVPHLRYAAEYAEDEDMRTSCAETLEYLSGFAKDIVDNNYHIRTKDKDGNPYSPGHSGDAEADKNAGDLASFVDWEDFIPGAECNAKRTSALMAYGDGRDNDCGLGSINAYEVAATNTHYYNAAIVRYFHLAHLANALVLRDNDAAQALVQGLADRLDTYEAEYSPKVSAVEWERDLAQLSIRAAAFGLPLNSREARWVIEDWSEAIDRFSTWPNWNLWDESVPDGPVSYRPSDMTVEEEVEYRWARIEDLTFIFEYCWSPFKNPAGANFVDCDLVRDPTQW